MKCSVCFAANKENYNTHWVRDKNGKVTCPTLLSQQCNHCKKLGHTPKYCPDLKRAEKNRKRNEYRESEGEVKFKKNPLVKRTPRKKKNTFLVLVDESDCEENDLEVPDAKDEVVPLQTPSWSMIVQKGPEKTETAVAAAIGIETSAYEVEGFVADIVPAMAKAPTKRKLWSEMESDDDEDW